MAAERNTSVQGPGRWWEETRKRGWHPLVGSRKASFIIEVII